MSGWIHSIAALLAKAGPHVFENRCTDICVYRGGTWYAQASRTWLTVNGKQVESKQN